MQNSREKSYKSAQMLFVDEGLENAHVTKLSASQLYKKIN